jgi:hypothetical protein
MIILQIIVDMMPIEGKYSFASREEMLSYIARKIDTLLGPT